MNSNCISVINNDISIQQHLINEVFNCVNDINNNIDPNTDKFMIKFLLLQKKSISSFK